MWINIGKFSKEKFCLTNNSNMKNCIHILPPDPRGDMNMEKYCPRPLGPSNIFQLWLLRWLFWGGMTQALRAVGDVGCWRHWSAIVATHCAMCHRRNAHAPTLRSHFTRLPPSYCSLCKYFGQRTTCVPILIHLAEGSSIKTMHNGEVAMGRSD